jgi:hypothetical protein
VGALLGKLAAIGAAVLVLDDIHDGDPSTWELVAYLGRNPIPAPVLIVMATRTAPAERGELGSLIGGLTKDGLADEIRLEPMVVGELAALASAALGEAAPDVVAWVLERSRALCSWCRWSPGPWRSLPSSRGGRPCCTTTGCSSADLRGGGPSRPSWRDGC